MAEWRQTVRFGPAQIDHQRQRRRRPRSADQPDAPRLDQPGDGRRGRGDHGIVPARQFDLVVGDQHRPLPDLVFDGPDGHKKTIADFSGKTLLVNLWATWCVPCREEMPALNALQKTLGSDRFEVVAINIDIGDDEKPKAFFDEIGVHDLAFYRDASMGVFNTLKKEGLAFGLPVTLLMDEKGCLISAMNGPAAWDSEDAKALINAAVAAPKT